MKVAFSISSPLLAPQPHEISHEKYLIDSKLYLYWKMNCLWKRTSLMRESVSPNSSSVSPQKPTITSVERATPGIAERTCETRSR